MEAELTMRDLLRHFPTLHFAGLKGLRVLLMLPDLLTLDDPVVIRYYVELASARLCYGLIGRPNHDGDTADMTRSHVVEVLFPQLAQRVFASHESSPLKNSI
jgi:hypothetical protein